MAPITVTRDGDRLHITVGDQVVSTGPDDLILVEAALGLAEPDPLRLRAGGSLVWHER